MGFEKIKEIKRESEKRFDKLDKVNILREDKVTKVKMTKEEKEKVKNEEKARKKEEKDIKNENKKVLKEVIDLLPFLDVTENNDFLLKDNKYLDIYQIESKDTSGFSDLEMELHILWWTRFLRTYTYDHTIVGMNFPVDTQDQQEYVKRKIKNANDDISIYFLNKKLKELEFMEKNRFNKEFFILIFAEGEKNYKDSKRTLKRSINRGFWVEDVDLKKKAKILFKLNNMNSKIV